MSKFANQKETLECPKCRGVAAHVPDGDDMVKCLACGESRTADSSQSRSESAGGSDE